MKLKKQYSKHNIYIYTHTNQKFEDKFEIINK